MSTWSMISLQDANTHIAEQMIFFYDTVMMVNSSILMLIFYGILCIINNKIIMKYLTHANLTEIVWTIIPMVILFMLSLPSLKLLYLCDETVIPQITIKIIGHQWYWTYEYTDFGVIQFDSYMEKSFKSDQFRLLDVDNRLIVPIKINIRFMITSADVIHSWSVPSLGIKLDAIPGRLNQAMANVIRPGLYFGQCSEICGVNHSFMPIVVEAISLKMFLKWLVLNK